MKFPTVDAAQEWSTKHGRHIFVEIEGADGVLEVYPGGRTIFRAANLGKVYERYLAKLTPDTDFDDARQATRIAELERELAECREDANESRDSKVRQALGRLAAMDEVVALKKRMRQFVVCQRVIGDLIGFPYEEDPGLFSGRITAAFTELRTQVENLSKPIDMILPCPHCKCLHVDAPEPENGWTNPPHKSHLCHYCMTVWRPADVATNGVSQIKTRGANDDWPLHA